MEKGIPAVPLMFAPRPANREERKKNSPLMCVTAKREGHGEYVGRRLPPGPEKTRPSTARIGPRNHETEALLRKMPILTSEHPNERGLPLLAERGWDDQQDAAFPFGPALGENARGAGVARQEPRPGMVKRC